MSALDRPVRAPIQDWTHYTVRPSDVLAALDDEQREALAQAVCDEVKRLRQALLKFGRHTNACRIVPCDCGWAAFAHGRPATALTHDRAASAAQENHGATRPTTPEEGR